MDITDRILRYREAVRMLWRAISDPNGPLNELDLGPAEELFGVACAYVFPLIVLGNPDIHTAPLRTSENSCYPYEEPLEGLVVRVGHEIEGLLVEGSRSGAWQMTRLDRLKEFGYVDLFDWGGSGDRDFDFIRCVDFETGTRYLVPFGRATRVIQTSASAPNGGRPLE